MAGTTGPERRGRERSRGHAWLVAAGLGLLLLVFACPPGSGSAEWAELIVESGLDDSVLVDLRWHVRGGGVEGPIARGLEPGEAAQFGIRTGQRVCLRVIAGTGGRVTTVDVPVAESATRVRIPLDRSLLNRPTSEAIRCEPELAAHRVRVAPGRYFDPDRPDRIRRERILTRNRSVAPADPDPQEPR